MFNHHTHMDGWPRNDFLNSTVRSSNFELIKNTKLNSNLILSLCVTPWSITVPSPFPVSLSVKVDTSPRIQKLKYVIRTSYTSWSSLSNIFVHPTVYVVVGQADFVFQMGGTGFKINWQIPCGCWTTGRRTRASQGKEEDDDDDNCTTTNKQQRINKWNIHLKWLGRRTGMTHQATFDNRFTSSCRGCHKIWQN